MSAENHPRKAWHGLSKGLLEGEFGAGRTEIYLAHQRDLAEEYAGDNTDMIVVEVEDLSQNPLILDTPEAFREAWLASKASDVIGMFHPDQSSHFAAWARKNGHDAIVMPLPAFEGDIGYRWAGGTFGEPQTIILDSSKIRVVHVHDHLDAHRL